MPSVTPYRRKGTGPGRYIARLSIGKDPATGKYAKPTRIYHAESLRDAKARAVILEHECRQAGGSTATFGHLIEQWMQDNPAGNRDNTRDNYRSKIDGHIAPRLGSISLARLAASDFTRLRLGMEQEGYAPSTINQCLSICKAACKHGVAGLGWLKVNPTREVSRATMHATQPEATKVADMSTVLDASDTGVQTITLFAALTGCRISELCGLTWADIDHTASTVTVSQMVDRKGTIWPTKTHSTRVVPLDSVGLQLMSSWAERALATIAELEGINRRALMPAWFVFADHTKGTETPPSPERWARRLKAACVAAGLPPDAVLFHGLRHLAASLMVDQGHSPTAIAAIMGHARPSMTLDVYAAPALGESRAAVAGLSAALTGAIDV